VARDSLFMERIVWTGRPKATAAPPGYRVASLTMAVIASVATAFAVVVASLHEPCGGLILLSAWCSTIALFARFGPGIWRSELSFVVTDKHVMWKRGRLRRTIDRAGISYARIHWHPSIPGVGDLELVRAVPTGALRRRLSLRLPGVAAPDRLWAIIRGVPTAGGAGNGDRPLAQRLDEGERVLWAARPAGSWRTYLPTGWREAATALTAAAVTGALVREITRGIPALRRVLGAGMEAHSAAFVGLVTGVTLTALLLAGVAAGMGYWALWRPVRLNKKTRYLITDKRVLIQRGREELCLDRARIVDVIATPTQNGLRDLFLVLDGPKARAVAAGGAFGERDVAGLVPVLYAVSDADEVSQILRLPTGAPAPLTDAA
jgi:hypothetical protein